LGEKIDAAPKAPWPHRLVVNPRDAYNLYYSRGVSSRSSGIAKAYVSPLQGLSCAQIKDEAARVSARAAIASGAQDQNATNDTIATTAAVILFWPAAFIIKGNGANAQEVAQLKGDLDAIEQANIQKEKRNPIQ
jgi:hypothetical protein